MRTAGPWRAAAAAAGLLGEDGAPRPTIFAEMSALALRTGAINLGQGFPDDDGPESVKRVASEALLAGVNQYPPGPGIPELRRAVTDHQRRHYGLDLDRDTEVLVTTGATEALAASLLALTEPGDGVITLEPFYDAYGALIALAGGEHVTVPLLATAEGFRPDLEAMAHAAALPGTRLLLLNSPHNPTGSVLRPGELEAIARIASEHDLLVVTDEVYEHLTFDGVTHVPIASLPGMRERTLTISSVGKTFSFTGWKVGWVSGPAELIDALRAVKQFLTYVSGAPFQPAVAHALDLETTDDPDAGFVAALATSLAHRRDLLVTALEQAGLRTLRPEGTYFVIADASAVTARLGLPDAAALCRALPDLCGVVAVPVSAFTRAGSPTDRALRQHVRFTFTKSEATLQEAVRRLPRLAG
ncbi:aminotransferase class I/II-fold pyridoxal phosphate-dependent enzyme [Pseudactinotalea sp.]|uniref:aminotransferase class I/II-fold pyridoxal phosphate-dependent enzyme n=1 Tax=Pseudactinotalea sp. TaxID=1926260 RepID=UPI003B3B98BB